KADATSKLVEITDSKTVMGGVLEWRQKHEDQGYITQKNAHLAKAIIAALRNRKARTAFKWVKGHRGHPMNEKADKLAGEAVTKAGPDELNVVIPPNLNLSGAKLSCMTQKLAYRAIRNIKEASLQSRKRTERNLENVASEIREVFGLHPPNKMIWKGLRSRHITHGTRYFLWMAMHDAYMIGDQWLRPNMSAELQERATCKVCGSTESMDHILFRCETVGQQTVWLLLKDIW
ncbi:hypothetical protein DICSQDRAFT_19514, partial [Dichomitus squalens LYAD-421 SS1]